MIENKIINQTQNYFSIYFGYFIINVFILLFNIKNIFIIKDFYYQIQMQKNNNCVYIISISWFHSTYIFTYFSIYHDFYPLFSNLTPIQIISFCFLSKYIFKSQIYKYHYFSLIIICIILLCNNYLNLSDNFKLNYKIIVGSLFLIYIYTLLDMKGHFFYMKLDLFIFVFNIIRNCRNNKIGIFILFINYFQDYIFSI